MQETIVKIAKQLEQKRYGKFRGVVSDNKDPQKRGRLKLRVPSVLADQETDWALPCLPFGGGDGYGWFAVPDIDAQVWMEFEEGDVHKPLWVGTFWQQAEQVPEPAALDEPTTRLLKTPGGHILEFDDKEGEERFYLYHPSEAQLEIDPQGSIALTDAQGATLKMDAEGGEIVIEDANGNTLTLNSSGTTVQDANGNKIEMAAAGITLEGQQIVVKGSQVMLGGQGGEPIIKGQSFLTLFATHVHPTAMGPSGPPIPQGEMSTLSMKVMTG